MAKEIKVKIKFLKLNSALFKDLYGRNFGFVIKAIARAMNDIFEKKYLSIFLIILFAVLYWKTSLVAAFFWVLFLAFAAYGWESRIVAVLALAAIAFCPIFLYCKKDVLAEAAAVCAFFFLTITVALQFIEYKRRDEEI